MLATLAVKAVASLGGIIGSGLDPHHKGLIAGAALTLSLAGDAVLTQLHMRKRG
jgi:hypothetical protein